MAGRIRALIPFPRGICLKVNVIARLEFELAYYDSTVLCYTRLHHEDTLPLDRNRWNLLTVCKKIITKICLEIIYLVCMYKKNLVLNNLQWLMCHKTKQNKTKIEILETIYIYNICKLFVLDRNTWYHLTVQTI